MKQFLLLRDEEQFRPDQIRRLRKSRRENQTEFWQRFGVTQSRGSRFELGMELPNSVAILVRLYLEGTVTDRDLHRARLSLTEAVDLASHQQRALTEPLAA